MLANARHKNIDIQVDCESENIEVLAKHSSLESILMNLIDNAVKYSPQFGQILIVIYATDQHVYLEVHDSGSGISEEQRDLVFQRFVRLQETQNQVIGSGLGLSIVQSAVESIHASIQLNSSEQLKGLKVSVIFKK